MSSCKSIIFLILLLVCAPLSAAQLAIQADYPNNPVRVVVPYVAGGPMDYLARTIGRKIQNITTLVIDNKPGAGGALGADFVAKSAPDGYTMLHTSSSHASLPIISKNLPYDSVKDFAPVTLLVNSVGLLMVTHPGVSARTVREFVANAKAQPGKFTYGSAGVGNLMQFAAETFNLMANTQLMHVPYKGVAQALTDLMGGRIDVAFGPATAMQAQIKSGKLRALGITAANRWSRLPDVPTIEESGVKGYLFVPWYGFWFPANTPEAYVNRMRNEMVKAMEDEEIRRNFSEQGFVVSGSTSEEFSKIIIDEIETNKRLASRIGLIPE